MSHMDSVLSNRFFSEASATDTDVSHPAFKFDSPLLHRATQRLVSNPTLVELDAEFTNLADHETVLPLMRLAHANALWRWVQHHEGLPLPDDARSLLQHASAGEGATVDLAQLAEYPAVTASLIVASVCMAVQQVQQRQTQEENTVPVVLVMEGVGLTVKALCSNNPSDSAPGHNDEMENPVLSLLAKHVNTEDDRLSVELTAEFVDTWCNAFGCTPRQSRRRRHRSQRSVSPRASGASRSGRDRTVARAHHQPHVPDADDYNTVKMRGARSVDNRVRDKTKARQRDERSAGMGDP
eukprot:m.82411 g.82411  ORF g.82411 m.82411 type:complete len:296 (+) comp9464_c0_seq1:129-1016(+)